MSLIYQSQLSLVHLFEQSGSLECYNILLAQYPWSVRTKRRGRQSAGTDPLGHRRCTDLQHCGGFTEREFCPIAPLPRNVYADFLSVPKCAIAASIPAFPLRRQMATTVQNGRGHSLGLQTCQSAHEFYGVRCRDITMLADADFLQSAASCDPATPPYEKLYFWPLCGDHDLDHQRAHNALLPFGLIPRMRPEAPQLGTEFEECTPLLLAQARSTLCAQCFEFLLEGCLGTQCQIPTPLELGRHESVRSIDCIILPPRPGNLVARLLESEGFLLDAIVLDASLELQSREGSVDSQRSGSCLGTPLREPCGIAASRSDIAHSLSVAFAAC